MTLLGPVAGRPGFFDIAMVEHKRTRDAVRVSVAGDERRAMWLPLSQVRVHTRETNDLILGGGAPVVVTAPEWLARERGLM
ncbi:MAG: hypothetical protein CMN87_12275 [Stappia sp.]|uniref:hypothetical protein n=1 Tax=Stappia sp. TaxID=1870903 RepID=UPI000C4DAAA4|nr:hypothetical protein [Stappia sp.]MAB00139.1 hypothetical protein [Stappia sp.]MBM20778.1 hypothetical protein [Stappia sp.]|tara:strand:- start:780 stop:1022 length:243 start_codon:yes stop_codon:yes gene_type:complete